MANKELINDFDDVTKLYMKDISKSKPLSVEEEIKLWNRYKNGDKSAKNKLITSNLKFVAKIANKYRGRGLSYSDLISEGNIGLIKSLDYFDINRGNRILSYSVWWIKQSILEAIEKRNSYISKPDIENIENNGAISGNKKIDKEFSEYEMDNTVSNINDHQTEFINKIMKVLNKRERDLLTMYYGIGSGVPCTLEDVGDEFGLTKERVRQINEKSLKKLRSKIIEEKSLNNIYK